MNRERQYPRRVRTRLDGAAYAQPSAVCSITIATADRLPVFATADLASACGDLLLKQGAACGMTLHAYCFMPDHLHLLISPSPTISLIEFVRRFKSLTTRLFWEHHGQGHPWQTGFYDHFLRRDEDLDHVAAYILGNPVRAGLVNEPSAYEFSGPKSSAS